MKTINKLLVIFKNMGRIVTLLTAASIFSIWFLLTGQQPAGVETSKSVCGDNFCSVDENKNSCASDCDELTCHEAYQTTEDLCIKNGWQKAEVIVDGVKRELLWKEPKRWTEGAIVFFHGGEGVDSNICAAIPKELNRLLSDVLRGEPVVDFSQKALDQGFAVFSLNSSFNRATDKNDLPLGKRWDSFGSGDNSDNIDVAFADKVITEFIPSKRPRNGSTNIFLTGISNGGYMTTLSATQLSNKITAFAPVSSGNPYTTEVDTKANLIELRSCAPGQFLDIQSGQPTNTDGACGISATHDGLDIPADAKKIPFKHFHSPGDSLVDFSCLEKDVAMLESLGHINEGTVTFGDGSNKTLPSHFWQYEYNQPILDFFSKF